MKVWLSWNQFLNRWRRKGFWLYTALILGSFAYVWYSIGHLPPPPPAPQKKPKKGMERLSRQRRNSVEITLKRHPDNQLSQLHEQQLQKEPHVVDTWSRKQLTRYLHDERIYPPTDLPLDDLRAKVRDLYDHDMQHMS
ncbi:hypothetical protein JNB11_03975 [Kocuria palustris]|nr:hypothetical protein [Kocuria palustris]